MNEIKQIQEDSFVKRNHLLEQFADNGIEKSISEDDFSAKYGEGHQVFTMKSINSFIDDATKEEASDEVVKGIEDQLGTLTKVVVKTADGYESRFVREVAAGDITKGEGEPEDEDEDENEDEDEGSEENEDGDDVSKGESDFGAEFENIEE